MNRNGTMSQNTRYIYIIRQLPITICKCKSTMLFHKASVAARWPFRLRWKQSGAKKLRSGSSVPSYGTNQNEKYLNSCRMPLWAKQGRNLPFLFTDRQTPVQLRHENIAIYIIAETYIHVHIQYKLVLALRGG